MATPYRTLEQRRFPPTQKGNCGAEKKQWRKYKFPVLVKNHGAVTSICFSPVAPHTFAVTSATRVQIFSPTTQQVTKTFSRFKDIAYSGSFRQDGKLLVAGGEEAKVRVFHLDSRAILRTFVGHQGAVHVTQFSPDNVHVFSGSDDKTVRYWDVPSEQELTAMTDHEDYVRCGSVVLSSPWLWVTGSYDHTIKLWDFRTKAAVMTVDHGHPVEAVASFSNAQALVSAGVNNEIKVWDVLSGGKLLRSVSNHQKTITSLSFNSDETRLLSGSLDHHLKIYDVSNYSVVHSFKYNAPILSAALSPDSGHLVCGLSDGILSIRHKVDKTILPEFQKPKKRMQGNTKRYFMRGTDYIPENEVYVVEESLAKKKKLHTYDKLLKQFQYKKALDAALETNSKVIVYSMVEELVHRDGIQIALSGRDFRQLQPLLSFIVKNITDPRYSDLLINLAHLTLDLYAGIVGKSSEIDKLLFKMSQQIKDEVDFQKQLFGLLGNMDLTYKQHIT